MRQPIERDAREVLRRKGAETGSVLVRFDGRDFFTTTQMAGIFLRHAQQVLDAGESELVPLAHRDGIELLLVTPNVPFSVHDASGKGACETPKHRSSTIPIGNSGLVLDHD